LSLIPEGYSEEQLDAILSNTEFHRTFSEEIFSLKVLNSLKIADYNSRNTLKRQIYIAAITCLETYLSDAFLNTVLSNKQYLKSFFYSFKDFRKQKIGLNELFNYANKAEEIAKKALLEVIFNNLPKVRKMYESTLCITFPEFSEVQKYIVTRHDLVHRN
jgi:phospholipid N-methyltransferase